MRQVWGAEALRKAKKDAERYRFVRDNGCLDYWDLHGDKTIAAAGDAIDRAIDEAIAERALKIADKAPRIADKTGS